MTLGPLVRGIQRAYPQIWFACHVVHRKRGPAVELTDREAGILSHIDATPGIRATDLAAHLGIGRPSLSAQIRRLEKIGLVTVRVGDNRRERRIHLTPRGERAASSGSPLDGMRLTRLLRRLKPADREAALHGLELLASAARSSSKDRSHAREEKRPRA
ncbi:MAG: MarR family transcriptional regulator [Vicinamibacteria bacterium]|nr:MarR family transcriptional regulator [Vicinamibacteria bacterium]